MLSHDNYTVTRQKNKLKKLSLCMLYIANIRMV